MAEALMLILLGMLIAILASLALAPMLWARAARVTTERIEQDVHSAAFSEASDHVSRKYEGKLAEREGALRSEIEQREGALRSEIEQLEASREKISSEASSRVSALEETRTTLEQEIAVRDAQLAESDHLFRSLAENVRNLGARADSLGREAADLGSRAEALSTEITNLGESHQDIAHALHPEATPEPAPLTPAPVAYEEPVAAELEEPTPVSQPTEAEQSEQMPEPEATAQQIMTTPPDPVEDETGIDPEDTAEPEVPAEIATEPTHSDRIRALRDGVSA